MASILCPYLSFTDTAREAMDAYHSLFGGDLTVMTFAEAGMDDPSVANLVMHSHLVSEHGYNLMASDTPPGVDAPTGVSSTVMISGDEADDLRRYFDGLADGGTVTMPLQRQFWGDVFGMVIDRFGVRWGIDIATAEGAA